VSTSTAPSPVARSLPGRWAQLVFGFLGWALAVALMVRSGLGLGPWDAFHAGLDRLTGMGIGVASIVTGVVVVLVGLRVGVRPGPATVANMVLIGVFIDLLLPMVPPARGWIAGLAYHLAGIALGGWFTGVYIAAGLGKGPRDGFTLGLAARTGWPVRRTRTVIELSVLAGGWALGGALGVGTLLFALLVGPSMQWGLRRWGVLQPAAALAEEERTLRRAA
jgi:uncharacterized membrane protein YczE